MGRKTFSGRSGRTTRRGSLAVAAVVIAAGMYPQAYARESVPTKDAALPAAQKVVEAYVDAHLKGNHAAAFRLMSKASLKKHKAILTKENFKQNAPMTGLLSVVKVNRIKEDIVVRLRADEKRGRSQAQIDIAKKVSDWTIPICLVREGKTWRIDLDKSKDLNDQAERANGKRKSGR